MRCACSCIWKTVVLISQWRVLSLSLLWCIHRKHRGWVTCATVNTAGCNFLFTASYQTITMTSYMIHCHATLRPTAVYVRVKYHMPHWETWISPIRKNAKSLPLDCVRRRWWLCSGGLSVAGTNQMRVCGVLLFLFFPLPCYSAYPLKDTHRDKRWVFFFVFSPNQYSNTRQFDIGRVWHSLSCWRASSRRQTENRRWQSIVVYQKLCQQRVDQSRLIRRDELLLTIFSRTGIYIPRMFSSMMFMRYSSSFFEDWILIDGEWSTHG